jgi:alkanesulfonate monooxygenase SsuD/methylene tetrahydromethanopterin reductase-like flavin-dependent oxidoreductase (luciferase family)
VKHGIFLPPFAEFADPRRVAALAADAEQAGWDGLFLWDHMLATPGMAVADAWTTLAAIAMTTSQLRIGPMVTPLSRRRPWVLARQIATLDQLCAGRLTVGIGLGDDGWREFSSFGEETSPNVRGQLLDESLQILQDLLAGNVVHHDGGRFVVDSTAFLPRPAQDLVPFWAAVRWPNRKPLARAARLHGCFPIFAGSGDWPAPPSVADLTALRGALTGLGAPRSHEVVVRVALHRLPEADRDEAVRAMAGAGVSWVLEAFGPGQPAGPVAEAVRAGPWRSGTLGR